jgi:hypothetical protein
MKKGLSVLAGGALIILLMSARIGGFAPDAGAASPSAPPNYPQAIPAPRAVERQAQMPGPQRRARATPAPVSSRNIKIDTDYGKMPVYFIPNRGQMDKQVAYYVQGKDKSLYFTPEGVTIALAKPAATETAQLEGGREGAKPGAREGDAGARPDRNTETGVGQWDSAGNLDRGLGSRPDPKALVLERSPDGLFERPEKEAAERWVVKLDFVGAAKGVKPVGEDETGAVVSYFKGNQKDWKAGLPTYSKIVYRDLWPGIDLVYHGTVNSLKYEFIVHPGSDPSQVRLAYRGVDNLKVDETGRLNVITPAGCFQDDVPVAYQNMDGKKIDVGLSYHLYASETHGSEDAAGVSKAGSGLSAHAYGFKVGAYDRSRTLVLDPAFLVYCGYIGGSSGDEAYAIAVDAFGNAYVTGTTYSDQNTFPVTVGPDLTHNGSGYGDTVSGGGDVFVAKINASGTALIYCGYIGGIDGETGYGIAVDGSGNAYVTGRTYSREDTFPVLVGPCLVSKINLHYLPVPDGFVAKVNAAGTALVYCGYLGGGKATGIAVDAGGSACVIGVGGGSLPVTVGPELTYNGGLDTFVAKVNSSGAFFDYYGYLGGAGDDWGEAIAVDTSGCAYVTGWTNSPESSFPLAVGPDLTQNGGQDAFVAKVNAAGTGLVYCGYIGGSGMDAGYGIAADDLGNAFITGSTTSTEATFPVLAGPDLTYNGFGDAFVAKVNAAGTGLDYCGYIGGSSTGPGTGGDVGWAISVDGKGRAHLTGATSSSEGFPVIGGPDLTYNGGASSYSYGDAFVAGVNPEGTALDYCGYIGGSGSDGGNGIAADTCGNAYVAGWTYSNEATFPVTVGPDLTFNGAGYGGYDAFVAKICHFDERIPKWAVGDIDGDGVDEVAVDFGASGLWLYSHGNWAPLSARNPESTLAADIDYDHEDEILADFGSSGLWLWNGGRWSQLSGEDVESLSAYDLFGIGTDVVVGAFGPSGVWVWLVARWEQWSGARADQVLVGELDGSRKIAGDFGPLGLWAWPLNTPSGWAQLRGANADYVALGKSAGGFLAADFGSLGLWVYRSILTGWVQLSGANPDFVITADTNADGNDEIVGDFGSLGLWLWDNQWIRLSGSDAQYMIRADVNGDGRDEIAVDFGSLGLWLWNNGAWSQLSGSISEYLVAADTDGDGKKEILADFGALGLWMWNDGNWSIISSSNPD